MLQLTKYINLIKILNVLKVYSSFYLSSVFKKVILWGYPISLTSEPTNLCNLNCPECPTGNKISTIQKGIMKFENYKKIIDETKKYLIYQMLYFQGEPFLNPELFEMIRYSESNNIYTTLSTNGHYLTTENNKKIISSGLKKLIVSVDGITQDSYEKYRLGGNLETVLHGIKDLVKTKRELNSKFPKIVIQFIVFRHNENEIYGIKKLSKSLKVNKLELKSAQIDYKKNKWLIPNTNHYSRYKEVNSEYIIKNKLKNKCLRIWNTLVITWDGSIIPCCFDKNNLFVFGNIHDRNVLLLWNSIDFNSFRTKILKNRKNIDICKNCTEGITR